MILTYSDFKSKLLSFTPAIKFHHELKQTDGSVKNYHIYGYNGNIFYECYIDSIDNASDVSEYESVYISNANQKVEPIEAATGWIKVRPRKASGDLQMKYIYFTTATDDDFDNDDDSDYTITINEAKTKTIIDFCPEYNYELSGGVLKALESDILSGTTKVNFIIAPDIPEQYGGNYYLISNKKITNDNKSFEMDDEPKLIKYDSQVATASKTRLELNHSVNRQINYEYNLKIYRV